jgi:hypothetical protein
VKHCHFSAIDESVRQQIYLSPGDLPDAEFVAGHMKANFGAERGQPKRVDSSLEHLRHNLTAVTEGPLPTDVLTAIDAAALKAQSKWPPYLTQAVGTSSGYDV